MSVFQNSATNPSSNEPWNGSTSVDNAVHNKVPHSLHSLQSSRSGGGGSKPAVPPKKRQKLAGSMSTRGPYAELGVAFGDPGPSSYMANNTTKSSSVTKGKAREAPRDGFDELASSITPVQSFMDQDSQYGSFDDSRDVRLSTVPGASDRSEREED
jgi:hypothetical protein